MKLKFDKFTSLFLVIILLGAFVVRLYRFNNPIADWHSWRQSDTSSVSRNFLNYGFDLLHPRMNNISNVQSGLENPKGYFFAEFPIYDAAQAGLFKLIGILTLEEWGRLLTICSSVCASLFLYLIVSRHSNKALGLLAASFYAFIPYDIYYGRVILPDTSMAMTMLGGIYFFDLWIEQKTKNKEAKTKTNDKMQKLIFAILAIVFTTISFLLKPYAIFFTLPMIVLAYKRFGWKLVFQWQLWLFALFSLTPLILWRIWMTQYPEGIPANAWLLNGNGIRFHPAFFRWIFYERFTKLISGYFGIIILISGLWWVKKLRNWLFFTSFLAGSLLYICVFATGNVQHDYYQILIMPSLAIFFAIGSYFLNQFRFQRLPIGAVVVVLCTIVGLFLGWQQVKDYFNINNPSIMIAGRAVQRLTPKNAKIIANYGGDSSFLYQTNRQGWASYEHPLPEMVKLGADYLAIANPNKDDFTYAKAYKVIAATPQYAIFDLRQKP
jgi:DNA-binding transcriptional regulator of glucitol operon